MTKWMYCLALFLILGGFALNKLERDYNSKNCLEEYDTNKCHLSKIKLYQDSEQGK